MDPITWIWLGSLVIGTFLEAESASDQVEAANEANELQAQMSDFNANIARREGEFAIKTMLLNINDVNQNARSFAAEQVAQMGASGFVVGVGSSAHILVDTATKNRLDVEALKAHGAIEKERAVMQEAFHRQQSQLFRAAKGDTTLAAVAPVIGGINQFASGYKTFFG